MFSKNKSPSNSSLHVPKKKRKKEDNREKYFKNGEPEKVIGLIEIKDECYLLVKWGDVGKAYVPYRFMKKHYPLLVLDYYLAQGEFRKY